MAMTIMRNRLDDCSTNEITEITGIERFSKLNQRILDNIFESSPTYETFSTRHFIHPKSVMVTKEQDHCSKDNFEDGKVFWIFGPVKPQEKSTNHTGSNTYVFGFFLIYRDTKTKTHTMLSCEICELTEEQEKHWIRDVIIPYEAEKLSKITPTPL